MYAGGPSCGLPIRLDRGLGNRREIPRELLHQRVGVALHAGAGGGVESPRRAQGIRLDAGDLVLHLLAEARKRVVAEDVETRHHVDQAPDVLDHRIAEYQRLALVVLAQPLADALDRLAETPVEVAYGIVQAFLDLVLDVAFDPVGVVRGELRHEVVGVRDGRDAVADAEPACSASFEG